MAKRIVMGITGASGAVYAQRLLQAITGAGIHIHLIVSSPGKRLLSEELNLKSIDLPALVGTHSDLVTLHSDNDIGAEVASGTFLHDGMIIIPASSNTLGAIAAGLGDTLLRRAAAVTLKERRPLILAHRETPLSHIDIVNMHTLSDAGAVIVPLAPGFYLHPETIDELVDFMTGKILDLLGITHDLNVRWSPSRGSQQLD